MRSCNAAAEVDQIFNVVTARPLEIETRQMRNALIPRVALGCGNFGGIGSSLAWVGHGQSEDEALAIMDAAWELGLTHFDTADAYGAGNSESAIGRWIASRGIRPTLTTKTFNPMAEGADSGLRRRADRAPVSDQPRAPRGRSHRALPRARLRPRHAAARDARRVPGARGCRLDLGLRGQQLQRRAARTRPRRRRSGRGPEWLLAARAR